MNKQWHGGKGSSPRKINNIKSYHNNFDAIFRQSKPKDEEKRDNDPTNYGISERNNEDRLHIRSTP